MSRFKYVDQDNYEPAPFAVLDDSDIVDRDGYRTTEQIVYELQSAGELLDANRRRQYEYDADSDPALDQLNPTRAVGFDVADVGPLTVEVAERIYKQVAAKVNEERAKEDADARPNDGGDNSGDK